MPKNIFLFRAFLFAQCEILIYLYFVTETNQPTKKMKTIDNTSTAYMSAFAPVRLRIQMPAAKFATLRITKDGKQIRDGRTYKTENAMKSNRKSRPADAKMFAVSYLGKGFFNLTAIA